MISTKVPLRFKALLVAVLASFCVSAFATKPVRDLPHMRSALDNLEKAQAELKLAEENKGGYKGKAMSDVSAAMKEVRLGIKSAGGAHASFHRESLSDQPHMKAALDFLAVAKSELEAATDNAGGHRGVALDFVDKAINNVNLGIAWAASK